jgi:hypothetical protein
MSSPSLQTVIEQIEKLSAEDKQKLMDYLQDEIAFEEELLDSVLGDVLDEKGQINFDMLYRQGKTAKELHDDFPDEIDEDGHIGTLDE